MSGGGSKRKIILDPSASQLSSSRKARGAESSDLLHSRGGRSSGGDKRASEGGRHGAKDSRDSSSGSKGTPSGGRPSVFSRLGTKGGGPSPSKAAASSSPALQQPRRSPSSEGRKLDRDTSRTAE